MGLLKVGSLTLHQMRESGDLNLWLPSVPYRALADGLFATRTPMPAGRTSYRTSSTRRGGRAWPETPWAAPRVLFLNVSGRDGGGTGMPV